MKNSQGLRILSQGHRVHLVALLAILLAACGGGNKAVVSQDNSVDYRSAVELPPLIKAAPQSSVNPVSVSKASAQPAPRLETSDTPTDPIASTATLNTAGIMSSARIDSSRLILNAPLAAAWEALNDQASNVGISIFSRNVAEARMYIGCGDMPEEASTETSGRWTFFKRDKKQSAAQYCSLQLEEQQGQTQVTVLDTSGSVVEPEYAEPIFNSLING